MVVFRMIATIAFKTQSFSKIYFFGKIVGFFSITWISQNIYNWRSTLFNVGEKNKLNDYMNEMLIGKKAKEKKAMIKKAVKQKNKAKIIFILVLNCNFN